MGNERTVAVVKQYGSRGIMVNSAADWGISDPLAVPKTAALMRQQAVSDEDIRKVTYHNAIEAFSQSGQIQEEDFGKGRQADQTLKYEGSSVLRGGQQPGVSQSSIIIR
jgi:hypothetical protein